MADAPQTIPSSVTGKSTIFGLNYDKTVDAQDNGVGNFVDPNTGKNYNTRDPNLVGVSLPVDVINKTIGYRNSESVQKKISNYRVNVTGPNGQSISAPIVDSGPAQWTGSAIDLTYGATKQLGLADNSRLTYSIIGPDGKTIPIQGNANTGSTVDTSSGVTRGSMAGKALQRYYEERTPYSYSFPIASPDQVEAFDQYQANGGDINKLSVKGRLSIAIAKDPAFLTRPENYNVFRQLVYPEIQKQDYWQNAMDAIGNIPAAFGKMKDDIVAGVKNGIDLASQWGQYTQEKLQGNVNQGKLDETKQKLANSTATLEDGAAKGVLDAVGMSDALISGGRVIGRNIAQSLPFAPQDIKNQWEEQKAQETQALAFRQYQYSQAASNFHKTVSDSYKSIPMIQEATTRLSNATTDPSAVAGGGMIMNPLNYIPLGAGARATEGAAVALRPAFFERLGDAASNVAKADAAATAAGFKTAALDSVNATMARTPEELSAYVAAKQAGADLSPDVRAAKATYAQAQQDFTNILNSTYQDAQKPGAATQMASTAAQAVQAPLETLAWGARKIMDFPASIAKRFANGNPEVEADLARRAEILIFDSASEHIPGAGAAIGALSAAPAALENLSTWAGALGKEGILGEATNPILKRVSQSAGPNLPGWISSQLDRPSIYAAGSAIKGALSGAATMGAIGAISNPANPVGGGIQGFAQGGLFGTVGGMVGAWKKFNSPNQFAAELIGDTNRFKSTMTSEELKGFNQLPDNVQRMIGSSSQAFPGLKLQFQDGPMEWPGTRYVTRDGRPAIVINPNSAQPILPFVSQSLTHFVAQQGHIPEVLNSILGNQATKTPGIYSKIENGEPVINSENGRYVPNDQFLSGKQAWIDTLKVQGEPTAHLRDEDFAKELFARDGANYLLSGQHVLDAKSAYRPGWLPMQGQKEVLSKLGFAFDRSSSISNPADLGAKGILSGFIKSRNIQRQWNSEEVPTQRVQVKDLKDNAAIAHSILNGAPEIVWQGNKPAMDKDGNVILRPRSEINRDFKQVVGKVIDSINSQPKQWQDNAAVRIIPTKDGSVNIATKFIPESAKAELRNMNGYSPFQGRHLDMLEHAIGTNIDQPNIMTFRYVNKQPSGRGGTYELSDRVATPLRFEISKKGVINVQAFDHNQFLQNWVDTMHDPTHGGLWKTAEAAVGDNTRLLSNHVNGQAADNGLDPAKVQALHRLWGIKALETGNPLDGVVDPKVKSALKSFSLQKINNLSFAHKSVPQL